ncbi:NB-ARC domain-containing protein [Streptomyces sp. NPDC051080]|uniref:NB-ARC domain-containing protein n=1 Tax=Streptomyces sp. NPDC051080 TaxID=3157222 RepID=UPI003429EE1B
MKSEEPAARRESTYVSNDLSGQVHGPSIQAQRIHGGITFNVQAPPGVGPDIRPDEVPPLPFPFVNRSKRLAELDAWLGTGRPRSVKVGFGALYGMSGVGKAALVSHWADEKRELFPDGQIYVDFAALREEPEGGDVSEAVRRCLRSLGVDESTIPASLADRTRLFRSRSSGRRLLVVLDNVSQPAQAASLIPKGEGSALLVTSGGLLGELALDGARMMPVRPLGRASGLELLTERCGEAVVAADRESAERLVDLCGGLPVALHIVAARLLTNPGLTPADLAGELADESGRLVGMSLGEERSVSAVLDLGYRELTPDTARLYRLLGWLPGTTFDVGVAAVAAGIDTSSTGTMLRALGSAGLLESTGDGRHRFHDLVRLHARERAAAEEPEGEQLALLGRVTTHYLALTALADRSIRQDRLRIADLTTLLSAAPDPFGTTGGTAPLDWLEAEHRNILDVLRAAVREETLRTEVWQLSEAFTALFFHHRHLGDWRESLELGAAAAAAALEPAAEARLRSLLSRPLMDQGEYDAARRELESAVACAEVSGDLVVRASVQEFSGRYWERFDLSRAMDAYRSALELNTAANEGRGAAIAAYFLGSAQDAAGDHGEALVTLRGAHAELTARDDPRMAARVLAAMGLAHDHLGEHDEAIRTLSEAARALRELQATHYEAQALVALAGIKERSAADPEAVRADLTRALEIYEAGGSPQAEVLRRRLEGTGETG